MNEESYMKRALSLAEKGKGITSPNPSVGAVVVQNGQVVGEGWHKGPGLSHAEVEAIDGAGEKAAGATLYVTLEPCNHYGRTPPCTRKILEAGISRVVVGCEDPNPYVSGGGKSFLEAKGVRVDTGVMRTEAETLIEEFIWYTKHDKMPFVTVKCAATLDGMIAASSGDSKWITNEKSRAYVHRLRHAADAILVGAGTVKADDPSLTARIDGFESKDPLRVILDRDLVIDETAKIFHVVSDADTIIVTSDGVNPSKEAALRNKGCSVWKVPRREDGFDLEAVLERLGALGVMSLFVEGGG